jgi:hyperosmotically inducible periplasmic protein
MKAKYLISLTLAATSALALVARADDSDSDRAHPGVFVSDSVITAKVKSQLLAQGVHEFGHIKVDTDRDGMVWLSGTAKSHEAEDRAVTIARDTKGVVRVKDDIRIAADAD